jgi:hypothetical protein
MGGFALAPSKKLHPKREHGNTMTGTEQSHVDEENREQGTGERERASLATADDKGQRALQRSI